MTTSTTRIVFRECGSELDTGFNCPNCGYKRYEVAVSKTELTTAEMLLWLVENFNVNIRDDCGLEVYIEYRKNGRWIDYFVGDGYECKTLSEAIKQAYDFAFL